MNGPTHRLVAGAAVSLYLADRESKVDASTLKPVVGGAAAAFFTNFPDMLEPAICPSHRAFFHSITFAAVIGLGLHRLNQWNAETDAEKFWKGIGMLVGSAYLIHLALDFTTAKSLPLIGKF